MSSNDPIETYSKHTRSDLGLSPSEWERLQSFLADAEPLFDAAKAESDIEMYKPAIWEDKDGSERFDPYGWVGEYPGDIVVTADKFGREEFKRLRTDIAGWLEILGPGTAQALLPYLPEKLRNLKNLLVTYSGKLIDYTQVVLAGRPPVEVELVQERGTSVRGRPLIEPTARQRARGSSEIVSQRVTFTVDTLPNLLLVRFHAELASQLSDLTTRSQSLDETLSDRTAYHSEFVEEGLPGNLFEKAMETDFTAPGVLAETRRLADQHMKDIVDLWEAYLEEVTMRTDITSGFDTTLKPISKLYELWVLQKLLTNLESFTGDTPEPTGDGMNKFRFGTDLRVRYDTSIALHSRYLTQFSGGSPHDPDYALERRTDDGGWKCLWIGDAKYKYTTGVDGGDAKRFLRYLVDCLPASPSTIGTMFCARGPQRPDVATEDYTIEFEITRPESDDAMESWFQDLLKEC